MYPANADILRLLSAIRYIRHMVVDTKADMQHAIASALELPSTWAKKVDYYNLGVHMANV